MNWLNELREKRGNDRIEPLVAAVTHVVEGDLFEMLEDDRQGFLSDGLGLLMANEGFHGEPEDVDEFVNVSLGLTEGDRQFIGGLGNAVGMWCRALLWLVGPGGVPEPLLETLAENGVDWRVDPYPVPEPPEDKRRSPGYKEVQMDLF